MNKLITIFVHGTIPFTRLPKEFSPLKLTALKNFFFCQPGLHKATTVSDRYHLKKIATKLAHVDPDQFPLEQFYIFGWSGELSAQARLQAAHQLYAELKAIYKDYETQYHEKPLIQLITHSHGGNVALNLAAVADDSLSITRLIALATPVQEATKHLSTNRLFKRIYNLHSHLDIVQVIDPQGLYGMGTIIAKNGPLEFIKKLILEKSLFSGRHFLPSPSIIQARIQYHHRDLLHIEFLLLPFYQALPNILMALKQEPITPTNITELIGNTEVNISIC